MPSTTRRRYKGELKLPTPLQESSFRSINKREVLGNSGCPEGSYNVSADLFDASTRELTKTGELLGKSRRSVLQEDALTKKDPAELVLNPVDVPCNTSKRRWSPLRSPPAFSKHSTPLTFSFRDSECSSQGFIPYSQSTPVAKPLQKTHPVGEGSSFVSMFTPKNHTKIHSRLSFQNTLLQQLTGRSLKRERPSKREDKESNRSGSQQSLSRDDLEEWVPPSATKRLKLAASLSFKAGHSCSLSSSSLWVEPHQQLRACHGFCTFLKPHPQQQGGKAE
ncbi:DNA damage-induced apoptosis suppressor protein-like [Eudromia elegans]